MHFLCIPENSRNSLKFSILLKTSSSSEKTGKTNVNFSSLKLINLKIKNLKINGFGKLKEKEIKLEDGINIVYGENEAGKSSLVNDTLYKAVYKNINKEKPRLCRGFFIAYDYLLLISLVSSTGSTIFPSL